MKLIMFISLSISLFSCAGTSKTKLSQKAKEMRILDSAKTPGCSVLDKVVGINEDGSEALANNHARNLSAGLEANGIYVNETVQNGSNIKVYATAYQCE